MASITLWSRLEPHSREVGMERSLQAAIRDPLWLLARQDQIGEFLGRDAGSPVKGTIIDRRVNIGQTVVASLNAPSLFLIAKDLTRMQIWVSVNEADIGEVHAEQPVSFTVDALV